MFKNYHIPGFKPCYKWNTFNTEPAVPVVLASSKVLNLVISGIPSIHKERRLQFDQQSKF